MFGFCFHNWKKWSEPRRQDVYNPGHTKEDSYPVYSYMIQFKECVRCGKVKTKKERV